MPSADSIMQDYEATYRDATLEVPEFYNFGFDVVDRWAEDRTKLALISVDPYRRECGTTQLLGPKGPVQQVC